MPDLTLAQAQTIVTAALVLRRFVIEYAAK